jgi:hypothetical protein
MRTAPASVTAKAIAGMAPPAGLEDSTTIDYVLVQTAKDLTFDTATNALRLDGVSPLTAFFSDLAALSSLPKSARGRRSAPARFLKAARRRGDEIGPEVSPRWTTESHVRAWYASARRRSASEQKAVIDAALIVLI